MLRRFRFGFVRRGTCPKFHKHLSRFAALRGFTSSSSPTNTALNLLQQTTVGRLSSEFQGRSGNLKAKDDEADAETRRRRQLEELVAASSAIPCTWRCSVCGGSWEQRVSERMKLFQEGMKRSQRRGEGAKGDQTEFGSKKSWCGCPHCLHRSGTSKKANVVESVSNKFPQLAREWNVLRNIFRSNSTGRSIDDNIDAEKDGRAAAVPVTSTVRASWCCSACGGEFEARVCDRCAIEEAEDTHLTTQHHKRSKKKSEDDDGEEDEDVLRASCPYCYTARQSAAVASSSPSPSSRQPSRYFNSGEVSDQLRAELLRRKKYRLLLELQGVAPAFADNTSTGGGIDDISVDANLPCDWVCSVCNHAWRDTIMQRTRLASPCPMCDGKVHSHEALMLCEVRRDVVREVVPNSIPEGLLQRLSVASPKTLTLQCPTCSNVYRMSVEERTSFPPPGRHHHRNYNVDDDADLGALSPCPVCEYTELLSLGALRSGGEVTSAKDAGTRAGESHQRRTGVGRTMRKRSKKDMRKYYQKQRVEHVYTFALDKQVPT